MTMFDTKSIYKNFCSKSLIYSKLYVYIYYIYVYINKYRKVCLINVYIIKKIYIKNMYNIKRNYQNKRSIK
jgi:hypothetical protein